MVELVISLTIIGIVTLASIGIITAQTKVKVLTTQTIEATNIAENAIECFRYAVNVDDGDGNFNKEFVDAFNKTLDEDEKLTPADDGSYTVNANGLPVNILIVDNTITVTATDSSGSEIVKETYTK